MKLTKEQALNETIELFEKLAEKTREGKAMRKHEIPGPWLNYSACCSCCEYDGQFLNDCANCPMKRCWIAKGDDVYEISVAPECLHDKSPYVKWQRFVSHKETFHTIPCCIDIEFFCLLIADLAREVKKISKEKTMEIIEKLANVKTMPELDALREEVVEKMIGHGEETFHKVQDAFRKAKNRLNRIPLKERTW